MNIKLSESSATTKPCPLEFEELVRSGRSDLNRHFLLKAFEFAYNAHLGQKRKSGEEYFVHPLEVAKTLAQMNFDATTIVAGLFHDLLEDTSVDYQTIQSQFGKDIADLVDSVTKIDFTTSKHSSGYQANLHKFTLSFAKDIRVLCIKLADRLHNMQTIHYLSAQKQFFKAKETFELYVPLAEKLGMYKLRDDLADASLKVLEPEAFAEIDSRLQDLYARSIDQINYIIHNIHFAIHGENKRYLVSGRIKSVCSIWRKIKDKNIQFDQISDIMGFRIITDTPPECYEVLGKLHVHYNAVFSRFKDYISVPKSNNYQSLHTVLMMSKIGRIEVQIRTHEMHFASQRGLSSHWRYKGGPEDKGIQYEWMRNMLDIAQVSENPGQFLENLKMELALDEIHCFTPKNQVITLKKGSTALDFAYAIHSDIGNKARKAFINGKASLLISKLNNGDIVEIITSPEPRNIIGWSRYVKSGKARAHILKNADFPKIQVTENTFAEELKNSGINYSSNHIVRLIQHYSLKSKSELFTLIAQNKITIQECAHILKKKSSSKNKVFKLHILNQADLPTIIKEVEAKAGKIAHIHIDHKGFYYFETQEI